MSVQSDKIRDKADRAIDTLLEIGRWVLMIAFIGGTGWILARAFGAGP